MKRRSFITVLAGAAAYVPAAHLQGSVRVIGVLNSASYGAFPGFEPAFAQGLKETGFIEHENLTIEWRWADGKYDRLPALARELVSRRVLVIAGLGAAAALAAKEATGSIPIVFVTGADPVKLGLVASINRPEGNITGVSDLISIVSPKRLELLRELLRSVGTTGLLVNPSNPIRADTLETQEAAANAFGGRLEVLTANTEDDLEAAFRAMIERRITALVVMPDPFFFAQREHLAALAARYAIPTIFPARAFAEVGGLISYGTNLAEQYRQAGVYTGKILMGAQPAALPVQQSTKFELVINLKTAKALGLAVPPSLLALADDVIE